MRPLVCTLVIATLAGSARPAASEDTVRWKDVDGWTIGVDRSVKDGCFMYWVGERGTIIRIGFDTSRTLYWILGHADWKSLERGKEYEIGVVFDGARPFTGKMRAGLLRRSIVLGIDVPRSFLDQFMRSHSMEVTFGTRPVANIKLRGSYAAGEEMILCQATIDGGRSSPSGPGARDPFDNAPNRPAARDPFADAPGRPTSRDPFR